MKDFMICFSFDFLSTLATVIQRWAAAGISSG